MLTTSIVTFAHMFLTKSNVGQPNCSRAYSCAIRACTLASTSLAYVTLPHGVYYEDDLTVWLTTRASSLGDISWCELCQEATIKDVAGA
jgi:hypothetical protein